MSGHSKWNNIKNRKGKQDAQRGKIFTKLGREILIAVKQGGPDINGNSKLKDVVAKCRANNMPNDTIQKAIKKASGEGSNTVYEEITYEGYGPGGIAVIINTSTDNRNRTAADVRHFFDKYGGKMGTSGCVSYMFSKKGVMIVNRQTNNISEDDLMLIAIDAGAEDFSAEEEYFEILTLPENFSQVRDTLEENGITFEQAELQLIPSTYMTVDEEIATKMELFVESLEDLDDVMEVYHNME